MANLYTGFHAVEERLRRYSAGNENGISLHIFYSKPGPRIKKIIALANSCGVENSVVSEKQLDTMAVSLNAEAREHRGIILSVEGEGERGKNLMDLNQWISTCPENALVVLLDSVTALLSNEMFRPDGITDFQAGNRVSQELLRFAEMTGNTVSVSDGIYSDARIFDDYTECYREALATADRSLAKVCDQVVEVAYGHKYFYKGDER